MNKIVVSRMRWYIVGFLALFSVALLLPHRRVAILTGPPPAPQQGPARAIDLVIALDTSNSMDGLIDAARQQLWETVAQLGHAEPRPVLRVGLISYGNTAYDPAAGWVRLDTDLTTDLDSVYARLFALRTRGGDEYVARALHVAVTNMSWSPEPGVRRMFIVAGNEPADQDRQIPLHQALGEARERQIGVNTIYCGNEQNGEAALWRSLARDGGGKFAAIDQSAAVSVATPVDGELARLSAALNRTYVAYGHGGSARAENQAAQDKNAASLGAPAAAARAVAKSSGLYRNDEWDLVDALKDGKLGQVKEAELPDELRKMNPGDRQVFLAQKAHEREALQKQIDALSLERASHVRAAKSKKMAGKRDLGEAIDSFF